MNVKPSLATFEQTLLKNQINKINRLIKTVATINSEFLLDPMSFENNPQKFILDRLNSDKDLPFKNFLIGDVFPADSDLTTRSLEELLYSIIKRDGKLIVNADSIPLIDAYLIY